MSAPWLTIVGIGEDGLEGLCSQARDAIRAASFIMGGERHLDLLGPHSAEKRPWGRPFAAGLAELKARRGRPTLVLASGDPFCFGIGATLARDLPPEEILSLPAPSAFSLAANRLAWPLQDCETLSLHGRPLELLWPCLQPGRRILALTSDETTPAAIAAALTERGFAASTLIVLEALGGPDERIRRETAATFALTDIQPLNIVAIEVVAAPGARILWRAPGLPDDAFAHDGQLTKRPIRAVALSALRPAAGQLLWDIGAGSGSIGIEWMLAHPANRAIAIEGDPERAARIAANACELGVPDLRVVTGRAPEALGDLPRPDAVFIGGGVSDDALLARAIAALPPGGRLVANAVTLEAQAVLGQRHAALGGELLSLAIGQAEPVGRFRGWRQAMPVQQWAWTKEERP